MQTYVVFLFLVKDSELTQKIYETLIPFIPMESWRQNCLKGYFIQKLYFLTLM